MRHRNIPIFIPHMGCPHQCVFCNQHSISGRERFSEKDVRFEIERALETVSSEDVVEIAFFGGSFTGIDRGLMLRLLQTAQQFVDAGRVRSIRLSTRPDYISDEILEILSRFSVKTIELGLQSIDDTVLNASHRGHTAAEAERACRAVVKAGFSLVGQMMIGLPEATRESEIETARRIVALGASAVRIYPTVVFYGTPLCEMAKSGAYVPLTQKDAVERSADVLEIFEQHGVPCIRLGLCATEDLISAERVFGGPNHPALGELIMSECYYRRIVRALREWDLIGKSAVLRVPARELSRAVGQRRQNINRLWEETQTKVRIIGDPHVNEMQIADINPNNPI